jgi:DNA-binding transcriptional LysR family regulator
VSRQVRGLEAQLGARLVTGPRHQLRLTEAGERLAGSLSTAFDVIAGALPGVGPSQELVVSCLGTLAMKWLIPRLPAFLEQQPSLQVRIVESHAPVDFSAGGAHAAIRIRDGSRLPGVRIEPFMMHYHGPVMAPSLRAEVGSDPARLLQLPRLHTETFRPAWTTWAERVGVTLPPSTLDREFEHNSYTLEAAAAGMGVAITAWAFAAEDIGRGRLTAPFGFAPMEDRFVFMRPAVAANPQAAAFGAWLKIEGARSPKPPAASVRP